MFLQKLAEEPLHLRAVAFFVDGLGGDFVKLGTGNNPRQHFAILEGMNGILPIREHERRHADRLPFAAVGFRPIGVTRQSIL